MLLLPALVRVQRCSTRTCVHPIVHMHVHDACCCYRTTQYSLYSCIYHYNNFETFGGWMQDGRSAR